MPPPLTSRLRGGIYGLLVGDALGVPYEFSAPEQLPAREQLEMEPPPGFPRAHGRVPPGTWSDDGAQALCLLASLLDRDRLDLADFSAKLLAWYEQGYLAVDGVVFDVGVQTGRAFRALASGVEPRAAGPAEERDNGNGSLMRVLPLALWHTGDDAALVHDAYEQSRVTHGHARSRVCCALYCLWVRRTLESDAEPWVAATATLRAMLVPGSDEEEALEWHVRPDEPAEGKGSGYVIDTLRSARQVASAHDSYEAVVKAAIALGNDTDTTACVAGGLAGVRHGEGGIPERWRSALRGRELVDPLLEALVAARHR
jgi:ADP-ribosylglycohydrolase